MKATVVWPSGLKEETEKAHCCGGRMFCEHIEPVICYSNKEFKQIREGKEETICFTGIGYVLSQFEGKEGDPELAFSCARIRLPEHPTAGVLK